MLSLTWKAKFENIDTRGSTVSLNDADSQAETEKGEERYKYNSFDAVA